MAASIPLTQTQNHLRSTADTRPLRVNFLRRRKTDLFPWEEGFPPLREIRYER